MRLVFWQNILSPHQLPYIVRLIDDERVDSVAVVASETMTGERREMGWAVSSFPGLERCDVYVSPGQKVVERLLSDRPAESWHLFSGIRAFPFVFEALRRSLRYQLKRGLIVERPYTYAGGCADGKPLLLHRLRFCLCDRKYAPHISKVFAMGHEAAQYYQSLSSHWEVYPFLYCTQDASFKTTSAARGLRFLFVGSLSRRKAPMTLLQAFARIEETRANSTLDFVGDGEERAAMEQYLRRHPLPNVWLLGTRSIYEIPDLMSAHDVLVLPSIYDGWGAVVNEALMQGLYVICSNRCGAKDLLAPERGCVFRAGDVADLSDKLRACLSAHERIVQARQERREWALAHISGEVVSRYVVDCLMGHEMVLGINK